MKTIKLNDPVDHGGQTYKELTLRKMKARDLRITEQEQNPAEKQIELIAVLTDTSPAVIDELSIPDFNALSEAISEMNTKKSTPRKH